MMPFGSLMMWMTDFTHHQYIKEKFQEKYFVLESYQQLAESIPLIAERIKTYVDEESM
jgi:hypothetical protein